MKLLVLHTVDPAARDAGGGTATVDLSPDIDVCTCPHRPLLIVPGPVSTNAFFQQRLAVLVA